jgi:hypothetical protein
MVNNTQAELTDVLGKLIVEKRKPGDYVIDKDIILL